MPRQDRVRELIELKERTRRNTYFSHLISSLLHRWKGQSAPTDFYVIRLVTILEVGVRDNIAELIDHDEKYAALSIDLARNVKIDLPLIRGVQARNITLGDIIAHSVPLNSFGQIVSHFDVLLGKSFRSLLVSAVSRWQTEVEKKVPTPIIADFDKVAARLSRLFEVRHIVTHELPNNNVYADTEVEEFLEAASQFAQAVEEVLTFEKFGLVPLTQTDMNISSYESYKKTDEELETVLQNVRSSLADSSDNAKWLDVLNKSQEAWKLFRQSEIEFRTYQYGGGTIRPTLANSSAESLTRSRIDELRIWLKTKEKFGV